MSDKEKRENIITALVGVAIIIFGFIAYNLKLLVLDSSDIREALDLQFREIFGKPNEIIISAIGACGGALIVSPIMRLAMTKRNEKRWREQEIADKDERIAMIRGKAALTTFKVMSLAVAILAAVLLIIGYLFAGMAVLALLIAQIVVFCVLFSRYSKRM